MMREEQGGPTAVFGVRQVKISSTVPETAAHRWSRGVAAWRINKNVGRKRNSSRAVKHFVVCVEVCKGNESVSEFGICRKLSDVVFQAAARRSLSVKSGK